MSLASLFDARSVAIIGASEDPTRIGGRPLRYTIDNGYRGRILPVNPKYDEIAGLRCYPDVGAIPEPPELCVVAVGSTMVPDTLRACGEAGVRSAVVFSAGYAEVGAEGRAAQEELAAIAAAAGMNLLGPNCLGAINLTTGLVASFTTTYESGGVPAGRIGFACQSGAFGSYFLALARARRLGLSAWVATGNEADVTVADCIAYLATHEGTDVIAGYTEGVRDGEALKDALALAHDAGKPVLLLKAGRSEAGTRAAVSHTGSMTGDDEVFSAVCERYGAYRVRDLAELLELSETCAGRRLPRGERLCLLTVSGGVGIMMADQAQEVGLELPAVPPTVRETLRRRVPFAGLENPVDFTGQLLNEPDLMETFLHELLATGAYDAVVTFLGHIIESASLGPPAIAAYVEAARHSDIPLFLSGLTLPDLQRQLREGGVPLIENPVTAVEVVKALATIQRRLAEPLPTASPGPGGVGGLAGLPSEAGVFDEATSLGVLQAVGVPVVGFRRVADVEAAVAAAAELGWPVVVKADAAGLAHKTEAGGVVLGVEDEAGVRAACRVIADNLEHHAPGALRGFVVAEMVGSGGGVEAIVGMRRDPVFGPVVVCGMGGVHAEAFGDRAVALAPVTPDEAARLIDRTRLGRVLAAPRSREGLDAAGLAAAVSALSVAAASEPRLAEVDVNPLLVLPDRVVALDALVVLRA